MSSDRFDDQSQLPVWLRNVPLPPRPDAPLPSSEVVSGAARADADLPPWLREEDDDSSTAAADNQALPPWLSSEPSASTPAPSEAPTARPHAQGFTGWLSSIDAPSETSSPDDEKSQFPEESDATSDEMPDWLRQLSGNIADPAPSETPAPQAPPSWLVVDVAHEVAPSDAPSWLTEEVPSAPVSPDVPSWLSESSAQAEEQAATPAWLDEPADQLASSDNQSWTASESLPVSDSKPASDWFSEPEQEHSVNSPWLDAPPSAPSQQTSDDDLPFPAFSLEPDAAEPQPSTSPSWLDAPPSAPSQRSSDDDLQFKPFSFDDDSGPSAASPSDVPPWLSADADLSQDETSLEAPAWLRVEGAADDSNPPSWLGTQPPPAPLPEQNSTAAPDSAEAITSDQALPDWLEDDSAATTDASEADWLDQAPTPANAALPDWLADEQVPVADMQAPASTAHPIEAMPEWLSDAPVPPVEQGLSTPAWLNDAPVPPAEQGLSTPAWLHDAPPIDEQASIPAVDEHTPEWLRENSIAETPDFTLSDVPESFVETTNEQPAWLSESLSTADTALHIPDEISTGAKPVESDAPNWLRTSAESAESDVPDWLRTSEASSVEPAPSASMAKDDALPPWLKDERGEPLPSAMAPGDTNLPAWLRGMQTQHGIEADLLSQMEAPQDMPAPAPQEDKSFNWFDEPESQSAASVPAQADTNLLGGAELPAWLRSDTEKAKEKPKESAEERPLDWLRKIGGADDEEQPGTKSAPRLNPIPLPTRTPAQLDAIALMRALSAQPYPQAAVSVEAEQRSILQTMGLGRILSILLLIALIAAIAVPSLSIPFQSTGSSAAAAPLLQQIQSLGENDTVLIGYEWDAQRVSEMRPLERAVIGQLLEQRVKLILVSTDPQASLLQFDLREQMTLRNYQGGGFDYILLGYRPGGDIALRSMAQDFRNVLRSDFQGRDATVGQLATRLENSEPRIRTLNDLSMVIVLADEPTDVQGWMEQIYPALGKPIAFLIPAGLQPVAQPYFQQHNVYALTGTRGALAYEQMRGGVVAAETTQAVGQVNLATVIFAVLLLISALGVFLTQLMRRRNTA